MVPCRQTTMPCIISSPVGNITLEHCVEGLHSLSLDRFLTDETFCPDKNCEVKISGNGSKIQKLVEETVSWLQTYFKDPYGLHKKNIPSICSLQGDSFYSKVWRILATQVPVGSTISYKELASLAGSPGAARAVGSAMKSNPVGIIVPCHRVTRSKDLGLYSGGTRQSVKKWLLEHEGWKNKFIKP